MKKQFQLIIVALFLTSLTGYGQDVGYKFPFEGNRLRSYFQHPSYIKTSGTDRERVSVGVSQPDSPNIHRCSDWWSGLCRYSY